MINSQSQIETSPSLQRGSGCPHLLVVGLGNPILGDDGVGWLAAEEVRRLLALPGEKDEEASVQVRSLPVDIECLSLGGLSLMEHLVGYQHAIIIDSINSGQVPVGEVRVMALEDLPNLNEGHTSSAHDTSLQTAIEMGRMMGAELPRKVVVVAIESPNVYDFSERLSPQAAAAVPVAAEVVMKLIHRI